jgi:predicted FMN-binding regulatory protein PaiB
MANKTPTERAYLIRCWHERNASPDASPTWRFSIEEVLGERHRRGFDDVESLIAFLLSELSEDEDPAGRQ